ncbi:hypothetical protein JTE90_020193 [Oedothorax gibbosus]|uniref:Uncharacterized protein n=1 Tax=Oedothorax gibbosus TaxID=931172 RepID=A0AAV6U1V6_9ARAC|nr:hypothetical protein JTE90_020193 [Oedothorax gibbosus]
MKGFGLACWTCVAVLCFAKASTNNAKNHRAEKRQDNSFLFFGGWRPVGPGYPFYNAEATNPFPSILSSLSTKNYATASNYYQAMPSRYQKDIYNYYPRPAIKHAPKKNTPIYMETLRPQKQQQKHRGGGNQGPQYLDLQGFDFQQLQNIDFKYLQDIIHQTKQIAFPNLNLPHGDKNFEIVEVSLDSLRQGGQSYGGRQNNGYPKGRNAQRNNKGGFNRSPQGRAPAQSPSQYEYISFAKTNPILPQTLNTILPQTFPKELEITPIQLPHSIPSIDELLKNIQVSEIPYEINNNKGGFQANYGNGGLTLNHQQQHRAPAQKPSVYAQPSYYTHQTEQPKKHHAPPQQKANNIQLQPDIDAELIKLGEHELKHLLSNIQVLDKNPNDLLKYLPVGNIGHSKNENVQLILSLPEAGFNEGENSPVRTYNTHKSTQQNTVYGNEGQFGGIVPHSRPHQTKEANSYSVNTGGYQIANHESYEQHEAAGYEAQDQAPRTNSVHYEQASYQSTGGQQGYHQQQDYHKDDEGHQTGYEDHQAGYEAKGEQYMGGQASPEPSDEHQGSYGQREQSYIQVISQQTDENGYRREPVLAVEIQHGQSVEDAIKSLDPETLKKIGRHGENGIEIEVVEVPVDDYASESKKTETVVSAKNSTIEAKPNATATTKT